MKYIKNHKAIRGMNDYLPDDTIILQKMENILKKIFNKYGFNEIRFPIIEYTNLFKRAIGNITNIIEKEMYSFKDRKGDNLSLRPEGTAGCVRAGIENGILYKKEQRLWYIGPMFRHERPQKGRYRQFNQLGAEIFGKPGPDVDAELILITIRCWQTIGINKHLSLELNSIGSLNTRIKYHKDINIFFNKNINLLNYEGRKRLQNNPIRLLESNYYNIKKILHNAPLISEYLESDSYKHLYDLCELLDNANIAYTINPLLVRGIDYYNNTVFEWITNILGSQNTICAGGRYDELVKQLGGYKTPAIGLAIGLERLALLIKKFNFINLNKPIIDIYIIINNKYYYLALLLAEKIHNVLPNIKIYTNNSGENLKKKINKAYKNNAIIALIIREKEVINKNIYLKFLTNIKKQEFIKNKNIIKKLIYIFKNKVKNA